MKVLISAGKNTKIIKDTLDKRYSTGAVKLTTEDNIEGVINSLKRCELIDKIVIVDKALPSDLDEMRESIVELVSCMNTEDDVKTVFITQDDDIADIISRETFNLDTRSKVVLFRGEKYVAPFFDKIITTSIEDIQGEYFIDKLSKTVVDRKEVSNESEDYEILNTNSTNNMNLMQGDLYGDDEEDEEPEVDDDQDEEYEHQWEQGGGSTDGGALLDEELFGSYTDDSENDAADESEDEGYNATEHEEIQEEPKKKQPEKKGFLGKSKQQKKENQSKGLFGKRKPEDKENKDKHTKNNDKKEEKDEAFGESLYENDDNSEFENIKGINKNNSSGLLNELNQLSSRGKLLLFTGIGGSGVSTISHNIASTLAQLGFTTLLVDMDVKNRSQAYLNREAFEIVHGTGMADVSLLRSINDPMNIPNYAVVVSEGLHIITTGLDGEPIDINKRVEKTKMSRFINMAMDTYQFVVVDIPFDMLCKYAAELAYVSENIVFVAEPNSRGLMQMLMLYGNIESEEIQETMFARTKVIMNKMTDNINVFDKKIKKTTELLKAIDSMAEEMTGSESSLRFNHMKLVGGIPFINGYDTQWLSKKTFVSSRNGLEMFMGILHEIVKG